MLPTVAAAAVCLYCATQSQLVALPCSIHQARWYLYQPGGAMARELAKNPTVLVVNDIVFAHGGLLPHHLKYGLQVRRAGHAAMEGRAGREAGRAAAAECADGVQWSCSWRLLLLHASHLHCIIPLTASALTLTRHPCPSLLLP